MSYRLFVTIESAAQGFFKTDDQKDPKSHRINAVGYSYDVTSPRDTATGQANGKRHHGPVKITKAFGPSTPQCFKALVTNETIKSVLIEFVNINAKTAQEQVYFTVKLTNSTISEVRQVAGVARPENHTDWPNEAEEISFTFRKIEMEHVPTHTIASDQAATP